MNAGGHLPPETPNTGTLTRHGSGRLSRRSIVPPTPKHASQAGSDVVDMSQKPPLPTRSGINWRLAWTLLGLAFDQLTWWKNLSPDFYSLEMEKTTLWLSVVLKMGFEESTVDSRCLRLSVTCPVAPLVARGELIRLEVMNANYVISVFAGGVRSEWRMSGQFVSLISLFFVLFDSTNIQS